MKLALAAAAVALIAAGPALAQTTTAAPAAPAAAATGALTLDSPVEAIVANPAGKAVLDTELPGLTGHPQYEQFKAMSLKQLQPMAPDQLTQERLDKVAAGLAKIGQ